MTPHIGSAISELRWNKGSDAAIETADVVIQTIIPAKFDHYSRRQKTEGIVWQNIALAFLVKAIVALVLGAEDWRLCGKQFLLM